MPLPRPVGVAKDPYVADDIDPGRPLLALPMIDERAILADIAEATDVFIQVADSEFRWLAINNASAEEFERIYGVRPRVGMSMLEALDGLPEHRAAVEAVWSRALAGEEFEETGEFGDIDRRTYEMRYRNYFDGDGQRIGAFQIVSDVTERVRAQANLERVEAALRQSQKLEAIGQLTGGLAHDFNNLLQIIAGNLDLLQRSLPADLMRLRRYVDNATRGTTRATELAHRLLAFAKPAPGIPTVIDANAVITSMSDLLRHAVGDRIRVSLDLLAETACIRVDSNQLESAILNLAMNARDAMPDGGSLVISTATGTAADLSPASHAKADLVSIVIGVADSGEGMDTHTLDHLFEPFFTTKAGQGTGLGLAMVYSFVHRAGGHIQVHSQPGIGSIFKLGFPRAPAEELHSAKGSCELAPRSRSGQVILVVEDDDDVRQHSVETLRDLGYRVLEAHDGQAALSLLTKHRGNIALMFCDLGLPNGETGWNLAARAREVQPSLRILYTSGSAEISNVESSVGGRSVIPKPFTAAGLAIRMQEALDRASDEADPEEPKG